MMREPQGEPILGVVAEVAGAEVVEGVAATDRLGMPAPPGLPIDGAGAAREGSAPDGVSLAEVGGKEGKKPPARPSNRALTIVVVLTTFVAALGGFLLNRASAASSNDGDFAQELSLQASAAEGSAYQRAETDLEQYHSLQALQAQAAEQMLEATYAQPNAPQWADMYAATAQQVAQTQKLVPSDLRPYLANGDPDPNFPFDFFAERASGSTYLSAQSNAYNDVSNKWSSLVDSYTAILTMVAVALFLFGSAFVLYGRNRLIFAALGGLLVVVGLAWGGWLAATREPSTPSTQAARDYAAGVTAIDQAVAHPEFQRAIDDFTAAIKLRPDYAEAYVQRAAAEAYRGSDQVGAGFVSVTNLSPYWAQRAAADELEAYKLGDHDASQVLNVGWAYYDLWVVSGGKAPAPARASQFFKEASQLDPTDPVPWMDLAVSELAQENYADAMSAFQAGTTRILHACTADGSSLTCNKPQPVTSFGLQRAWLAGAMEGLGSLAGTQEGSSSERLRATVSLMQGLLTDSIASGKLVTALPGAPPQVKGLAGFLDPNYLELYAPVPKGLTPQAMAHMPLTVLWYQRPVGARNWSAISETACWGSGQETCGRYDSADTSFEFLTQMLAADNQCFTNVEYKAELWLKGTLAGSFVLRPADDFIATNLAPALAKNMNIGVCAPATWSLQEQFPVALSVYGQHETVTGPLTSSELSYASPDRKEGVYLFRLYPERSTPSGGTVALPALVKTGETEAVNMLRGRGLPSDLTPRVSRSYSIWGTSLADMNATGYVSTSTRTEAFVGGAIVMPYSGGQQPGSEDSSASASVTGDYAVVVAIVYGPSSSTMWTGAHALALQVFSSFSLLSYG